MIVDLLWPGDVKEEVEETHDEGCWDEEGEEEEELESDPEVEPTPKELDFLNPPRPLRQQHSHHALPHLGPQARTPELQLPRPVRMAGWRKLHQHLMALS